MVEGASPADTMGAMTPRVRAGILSVGAGHGHDGCMQQFDIWKMAFFRFHRGSGIPLELGG